MFERDPRQLAAQPLDLEMLKILHPFAQLAGRAAQQAQRLGMAGQKIGMPAEIGQNIATADLPRNVGSSGALALGFVARKINHDRLPRRGRKRVAVWSARDEYNTHSSNIQRPATAGAVPSMRIDDAQWQRAGIPQM
jgi:hypothetical protein